MTITEALSEINLIKKRLADKRTMIQGMLIQAEHLADPYEKESGSSVVIQREMQAMSDLQTRLITLRKGISRANLETEVTIKEGDVVMTQSLHDWLIWKREVIHEHMSFLAATNGKVKAYIEQASRTPQVFKDDAGNVHLLKHKINVDYPAWQRSLSAVSAILEKLDGQLSLKNATVLV